MEHAVSDSLPYRGAALGEEAVRLPHDPGALLHGPDQQRGDLWFVTADEFEVQYPVVLGQDDPAAADGPFRQRTIWLGEGWEVVQRRVPRESSSLEARELLEQEVGTALAIARAYAHGRHAALFPLVGGYNLDAEEPFVLYPKQAHRPLSSLAGGVGLEDQHRIARDLVLVVRLLEGVGLVHRGLSPATVGWDGGRVQLLSLSHLARIGQPAIPSGQPPWASPEQRTGGGRVDARDALWSVGQLMYYVVFGRPGDPQGVAPDLATDRALTRVLGPVFASRAVDRPRAADLLPLLSCPDPFADEPSPGDPLDAFRQEFDRQLLLKRRHLGLPVTGPADPDAEAGGRGQGTVRRSRWRLGGSRARGTP